MTFAKLNFEKDILPYCVEHSQLDWLEETIKANTKRMPVYERITVQKDGKTKKCSVYDRTKDPIKYEDKVNYSGIKAAFCKKFMPELLKHPEGKPEKLTMLELVQRAKMGKK